MPARKVSPQSAKWTQKRVESFIRLRSRKTPESILGAALACNEQGWFYLTLRLLEAPKTLKKSTSLPFEWCWLAAQASAAIGDFKSAREWMERAPSPEETSARRKSSFQMIVALSVSDWDEAQRVGKTLLQSSAEATPDVTSIRARILLGVALLHGKRAFGEARSHFEEAATAIRSADGASPIDRQQLPALTRQIDFFSGQSYFLEGEFRQACQIWSAALARLHGLRNPGSDTNLFIHQLELLIALSEIHEGKPSHEKYARAFAEASRLSHHPSEQFELYLAHATQDVDLARRLWLGTRLPQFRRYIERFFEHDLFGAAGELLATVPANKDIPSQAARFASTASVIVDGWTGEADSDGPGLKLRPGQATQRLFEALALSPYGGLTLYELHGRIFGDEKFNPRSTPLKLRNVILRLRALLAGSGLGLRIEENQFRYRLIASQPVRIRLRWLADGRTHTELDPAQQQAYRQVALLARHFGDRPFQLKEALTLLRLNRSRASELIALALTQGWLTKKVGHRTTEYRWNPGRTSFAS